MKTTITAALTGAFACLFAVGAHGTLIGAHPSFPKINYSSASSTALIYETTNQIFMITASPSTIQFSGSEGPRIISGTKSLQIRVLVDSAGALVGGFPNDDFVLSGTVTRVFGGVTNTYTGVLLTGEVAAFGYLESGGTDQFDFRFIPTGGALLNFFSCGTLAVQVTSELSTFADTFTTRFIGRAKGVSGLEDPVAPTIVCPADMIVESQGFAGGLPGAFVSYPDPMVGDNCDTNPTVTFVPPSGSFFALPLNTATATYPVAAIVRDASGNSNSCMFNVTVQDTLPPQFADTNNPVIQSDLIHGLVLTNDPGQCYATFTLMLPFAIDNASLDLLATSVSAIDANGATIPLIDLGNGLLQGQFPVSHSGSNVVTVTANDGRGNTSQHQAAIFVVDTEPPVIHCPADQTVFVTNTPVYFEEPTASDNCPGVTSVCSPTNGSVLGGGIYPVVCVATDAAGNTNQCVFLLTVSNVPPAQPPVIACPPDKQLECSASTDPSNTGTATATFSCGTNVTVTYADAFVPANCTGKSVIHRTWTATDSCNLSSSCVQIISFFDTNAPVILTMPAGGDLGCNPTNVPTDAIVQTQVSAADDCSSTTLSVTHVDNSNACSVTRTFTITATDGCSNATTRTVAYTWTSDTMPPVIVCPTNVSVYLSLCSASVPTTNPAVVAFLNSVTASDNCGGVVVVTNNAPAAFAPGTNVVTFAAWDSCGNSAQCQGNVIVLPRPANCDPIEAVPDACRQSFDWGFSSQFVWFRGNLTLTGGDQSDDFRTTNRALGTLRVTIGKTNPAVVYCNDHISFNVVDNEPCSDTEKWLYRASDLEEVTYRFKDNQSYNASKDPNLPSSSATGFRNVGSLQTVFIGVSETRFRYAFQKATKPITVVINGIVLLSVNANGAVSTTFPRWVNGKTVEVLYPARLVPGDTVAWYATANPAAVSPTNQIYSQAVSANGTTTATYFNEGGRFLIKVPVSGIPLGCNDRTATVEYSIGEPGRTKTGCGSFSITSFRTVGWCWKFGNCSDDADEDDQEWDGWDQH